MSWSLSRVAREKTRGEEWLPWPLNASRRQYGADQSYPSGDRTCLRSLPFQSFLIAEARANVAAEGRPEAAVRGVRGGLRMFRHLAQDLKGQNEPRAAATRRVRRLSRTTVQTPWQLRAEPFHRQPGKSAAERETKCKPE